jgi:hypothetical protein
MIHKRVCSEDCALHHERCVPDYIDHFIQEHESFFNEADKVLIERQPIMGITNVQDLLFQRFRSKVLLVSPNTLHKHFKLSKDYSVRKEESENLCSEYLSSKLNYTKEYRKHDISDAMLMILYYSTLLPKKKRKILVNDFEQFRYLPKNSDNNF